MAQILEPTYEVLGPDAVEERLDAEPSLIALVLRATEEAAKMVDEQHVRAFALVFRDAIKGDRSIDVSVSLMDGLAALRPAVDTCCGSRTQTP